MRLWSVPEGQLLHDPAPDTALYVPAAHAVQSEEASLPSGEVDPAMMRSRQVPVHAASYLMSSTAL